MTQYTINPTCLYHPLTTVLLDDNTNFLDALKLGLPRDKQILSFDKPEQAALAIGHEEENIISNISNIYCEIDTDNPNKKLIDLDIGSIRNSIYDVSRFKHIGVLVVDYKMPGTTGTEFCRAIKDRHIYKVMLTAEAALDTAIEAFNEGVISKFILKANDDLVSHLSGVVHELEEQYFHDISKPILNNLDPSIVSMLSSDVFIELFNNVFYGSNAVEYYLLDTSGSYLFLDEKGSATWLIIRSDNDFNAQIDALLGLEGSDLMVEQLKQRDKLLFMLSEEEYRLPVDEWKKCLFSASKLSENLWYAIEKGPIKKSIDWENVEPYHGSE